MSWKQIFAAGTLAACLAVCHAAERDGQHDFDFNLGTWHTQITRLKHPLSGSKETFEMSGTVRVRPVWNGRALLEEIEADGSRGHWQTATLFLYNPKSRQWSQNFFNSANPEYSAPLVGSFHDGVGELYAQDTLDGRAILVRGRWSDITPDGHTYTESYSDDGGKTWEMVFVGHLTRLAGPNAGSVDAAQIKAHDGSHDFDFDIGTWHTHSSRLMHPLAEPRSGTNDWRDMDGMTVVSPIWGGRGNLAEYHADGPAGHVELLALRLYNPKTHQWNLNFATPQDGTLGVPGIGESKNGRITLYDQEAVNGRMVLVRFSIWSITADSAQSEQAFSDDGGKTWEVNWINRYTRTTNDIAGGKQ